MKKTFHIIATIFVIILFILNFWGDDILSLKPRWEHYRWYKTVGELAIKKMDFMRFGKDRKADDIIMSEARAENWDFSGQDGFHLIKTGDINVPFVTSVTYYFSDPNNKNIRHILIKTFIYDDIHYGWVPLSSDLGEFSNGKSKLLGHYVLWQGDYEVPFFK